MADEIEMTPQERQFLAVEMAKPDEVPGIERPSLSRSVPMPDDDAPQSGPPRAKWRCLATPDAFSSSFDYDGVRWLMEELSDTELDRIRNNASEIAAVLGLSVEIVEDRDEMAKALKANPKQAEKLADWRAKFNERLCVDHLRGWQALNGQPVPPFSPDAVRDLYATTKATLTKLIIAQSAIGEEAAPLGASSSPN